MVVGLLLIAHECLNKQHSMLVGYTQLWVKIDVALLEIVGHCTYMRISFG